MTSARQERAPRRAAGAAAAWLNEIPYPGALEQRVVELAPLIAILGASTAFAGEITAKATLFDVKGPSRVRSRV